MRDKKTFAFMRCVIDDVASTDVKVSDYLTKFYHTVFVLGHFCGRSSILQKAISVNVSVKPMKVPFLRWFTISLFAFIKLIKIKPDIVLWTWECFFPGGLLLKIMYPRTRVFVDIRSHPISQKTRLATAMYNALFVWTLKIAEMFVDGFTIISPSMRIYINKRFGIQFRGKKVCIWPSGFDKRLFSYIQEISQRHVGRLRTIFGIKEHHKVMIYYGSITYSRLPLFKLLIETVRILVEERQDIKLLIFGKGDAVREVKKLIHSKGLNENVLVFAPVPHYMIPIILNLSDIVITPFPRDHNWLTQVPLKVIEALGARKPVITTPLIEHKRIIPSEYLINYDELTPMNLKNRIKTILSNITEGDVSINVEEFSWDIIAERLYKCIEGEEVKSSY